MSSTSTISLHHHHQQQDVFPTSSPQTNSLSYPPRTKTLSADIEMNPLPSPSLNMGRTLEASAPEENGDGNVGASSEQIQTIWKPYMNRYRVGAACAMAFANGMNDAAPGALIASIEKYYDINYGTVSTIFVCNALGFIAAATFLNALARKIGRAKAFLLAEVILVIGYAIIASTPPFPVVAMSFFILGVGMGMNLAICLVFCANLANNTVMVGLYQGAYGIGGICGPLIATAFISHGSTWSRFYLVELGLASLNLCFAPRAFWDIDRDPADVPRGQLPASIPVATQHRSTQGKWHSFRNLITHKSTVLAALFTFAYQGAEVSISGWVISFLVQFRHGDPSKVGFVTSGFWAGIVVGRLTLSFLAHRFGERRFVFLLIAGALVVELLIWFVPSIPGDAVAVALSGLLLGPIHPCMVHIVQKLIPSRMQISSLSLISSLGSSGGAVAPFMTGMLAQSSGTFVLHPVCIGLFVSMAGSWWLLPKAERRDT